MLLSPIRSPIRSPFYSPLAKGGGGVTLASIFATGGMLKSVNYLDRQFVESTGQTAVSANDNPVGLSLGYAQWGGKTLAGLIAGQPERVINGGFDSDTAWSTDGTTKTIAGGVGVTTALASGQILAQVTPVPRVANEVYMIGYDVPSLSAGGYAARAPGHTGPARGIGTGFREFYRDDGSTNLLGVRAVGVTTGTIDNYSSKHIPGSHGLQTTTNFRPVYKTAEDGHWFFDGSDDSWLDTFLMGQEGMLAFDGTPTGTSDVFIGAKDTTNGNGYLGNNASGVICGAVGSDGFATIVDSTGTDRSNTRILALLKWSATQNLVQLKIDNVLVYSGPKMGAVSTTVPIREGALNNNGTAGSFFAGKAKMFYANNRFTTDAEDTAIYQQRII